MTVGRSWLQSRAERYLAIGVSVYGFELLVIVVAQASGAGSLLAVGLAFWLGLIASFWLQKLLTFGDGRLQRRILLPQALAFSLLVLFNFGFTLLVTRLFADVIPVVICRTFALGVTTIWNFYLYKTRIFTSPSDLDGPTQPLAVKTRQKNQLIRRYRKWRAKPRVKRLRALAVRPEFARLYLPMSLVILFGSALLWSLLGAHLQQSNADQLVNAHLFANKATLQGAAFPGQHTFLFKWPLFYLVKLFGYTSASFLWITVLSVEATVALFVFMLSRIERRPLVLGSLCLALASVLLLIPAQPYAGALLPVNMAMLATRNLEYMLYIGGLVYLIKAPRVRSWQFMSAVLLLGLLAASDKLFLSVGLLGALLAMVCYAVRKRWELVGLSANWLLAGIGAAAVATIVIAVINQAHITHIVGTQAGPYGVSQGAKSITVGIIFAVAGLLTNFGANPAYDATTLRGIPHHFFNHLLSPAGPAYLVNFVLLVFCLYISVRFLLKTLSVQKRKVPTMPPVSQLAALLLWSSLAVTGLFIGTNHYYQVDARYLTLWLFALFVMLAVWLRPRRVDAELVVIGLPVVLVALVCGVIGNIQTYNHQRQALDTVNHRNTVIAQTLASHHVKVLVGDYWRVLPIEQLSASRDQQVLPLQQCEQPRTALTSKNWQPDLRSTGFAYLLTFDGSLTDYPNCNLGQAEKAYGMPNSSALIDGSLAHPKELLLFYDRGIHVSTAAPSPAQTTSTVLPIALDDLPHTSCQVPTIMNIVAHQDDDLLFMNPDLLHDIASGHCIRTIYLTAGDAGASRPYWLAREQGSEAAYSEMTGSKAVWIQRIVRLPGGQFITVANPRGANNISLIFMHLPDGNLDGMGFPASHYQSLAELKSKQVSQLQTVDDQSSYTADQLTGALTTLMHTYQPAEIRTQSDYPGQQYKDHSDHLTTGQFAAQAYKQYEAQQFGGNVTIPLVYYRGYPIRQMPANVSGLDLQTKTAAFVAYAQFDRGVCQSQSACQHSPAYGSYLAREYHSSY